ncbi:MAG: vWA domain-containing protein [Candidatus Bathyarchaeia archaeon]
MSFQKDNQKVKILQDAAIDQPTLISDGFGFTVRIPAVRFLENRQIYFLGQKFPPNTSGKARVGRVFRAAVLHLTTHTLTPLPIAKAVPQAADSILEAFAKSLARDTLVNAYLQAQHPDRFVDIAYANALAFQRTKPSERIFAPATRVMSALLSRQNMGMVKGVLSAEEQQATEAVSTDLATLRDSYLASLAGDQVNVEGLFDEKVKNTKRQLEPFGPFFESPSLRHTESLGACSIFTEAELPNTADLEETFIKSIETLGGSVPAMDTIEECWRPEQEAEALQAFNSEQHAKERREKIMSRITPYVAQTRFKSVEFPEEDYTQYLRAKSLVQGASRRLLDALRTALDFLDEDPRQEMGQLDLTAVIQSIASNKPATDVFTLEEYLKQSFAWSVVLDVSKSMQVRGEYSRALAIAVAEAAKELMTDPSSWTFFGFSDRFYILKDSTESYSQRVRARIGGLRFDGLTYIPDAVHMAGKMLAKRFEEQRVLVVISDGWPYGYANMPNALKENVDELLKKGVIVIGIGVETDRMGTFFRLNSSVYKPKDLMKRFAPVFADASAKALET